MQIGSTVGNEHKAFLETPKKRINEKTQKIINSGLGLAFNFVWLCRI